MPKNYQGDDTAWITSIPVPADGDRATEKIFAPAFKREADRSAYLRRILPKIYQYSYENNGVAFWTYGNSYALETTVSVSGYVDVPSCAVGDKIQVSCFCTVARGGGVNETTDFDAYVDVTDQGGAQTHVPGAHWNAVGGVVDGYTHRFPINLTGVWTVAAAGTSRFTFALDSGNWGSDTFKIWSSFNIAAIRFPA